MAKTDPKPHVADYNDDDPEDKQLLPSSHTEHGFNPYPTTRSSTLYRHTLSIASALLTLWSLALLYLSGHRTTSTALHPTVPKLYTTMDSAISYEVKAFNQGLFGERTIYMGTPNNESEKAWRDVTRYGIIKLNASQVAQLPQATVPWKGHEGWWVGGVEMFHQLHCLDKLRKAIWAEHPETFYGRDNQKDEAADHIDHCIDFLRQSLMCHGSTDIITFRFDEGKAAYQPNFNGLHVCRRYEELRDWTREHRAGRNTPDGLEEEGKDES